MLREWMDRILHREKKINWVEISLARFGTIVPMINWDEIEESGPIKVHYELDIPVEAYYPTPVENEHIYESY
jgi:hypothetical protein